MKSERYPDKGLVSSRNDGTDPHTVAQKNCKSRENHPVGFLYCKRGLTVISSKLSETSPLTCIMYATAKLCRNDTRKLGSVKSGCD